MATKKAPKKRAPAGAPKIKYAEGRALLPGEEGFEKQMQLVHLKEVMSRLVGYGRKLQQSDKQMSLDVLTGAACIDVFINEYGRPEKAKRGRPSKVNKNQVARAFYIRRLVLGESELIAKGWCANAFDLSEEGVDYQLSVADKDHVQWWLKNLELVDEDSAAVYLSHDK